MPVELPRTIDVNRALLDRQLRSADGIPVGKVDDVEFDAPDQVQAPALTALLCGPTALGPRIGGRIGTWWTAIGRRLRPNDDPAPIRIPVSAVEGFEPPGLTLRLRRDEVGTQRLADWARDKIVSRIPGGRA